MRCPSAFDSATSKTVDGDDGAVSTEDLPADVAARFAKVVEATSRGTIRQPMRLRLPFSVSAIAAGRHVTLFYSNKPLHSGAEKWASLCVAASDCGAPQHAAPGTPWPTVVLTKVDETWKAVLVRPVEAPAEAAKEPPTVVSQPAEAPAAEVSYVSAATDEGPPNGVASIAVAVKLDAPPAAEAPCATDAPTVAEATCATDAPTAAGTDAVQVDGAADVTVREASASVSETPLTAEGQPAAEPPCMPQPPAEPESVPQGQLQHLSSLLATLSSATSAAVELNPCPDDLLTEAPAPDHFEDPPASAIEPPTPALEPYWAPRPDVSLDFAPPVAPLDEHDGAREAPTLVVPAGGAHSRRPSIIHAADAASRRASIFTAATASTVDSMPVGDHADICDLTLDLVTSNDAGYEYNSIGQGEGCTNSIDAASPVLQLPGAAACGLAGDADGDDVPPAATSPGASDAAPLPTDDSFGTPVHNVDVSFGSCDAADISAPETASVSAGVETASAEANRSTGSASPPRSHTSKPVRLASYGYLVPLGDVEEVGVAPPVGCFSFLFSCSRPGPAPVSRRYR